MIIMTLGRVTPVQEVGQVRELGSQYDIVSNDAVQMVLAFVPWPSV